MDENGRVEAGDSGTGKRRRSPGVRYPGASLPKVLAALRHIEEAGGTALIGTLSVRVGLKESNADFVRLIASARSYGLAEWANPNHTALLLTSEGAAALDDMAPDHAAALQRAILRPDAFAAVARKFEGKSLPGPQGLEAAFKVAGVAGSAATLAARNFLDSAATAGVIIQESGGRNILAGDLPYPTSDLPPTAGASSAAGVRGTRAASPATRPDAQVSRAPAAGVRSETVSVQPSVHIDIQVHIDPSATADQIDQIFASMARHLYGAR